MIKLIIFFYLIHFTTQGFVHVTQVDQAKFDSGKLVSLTTLDEDCYNKTTAELESKTEIPQVDGDPYGGNEIHLALERALRHKVAKRKCSKRNYPEGYNDYE